MLELHHAEVPCLLGMHKCRSQQPRLISITAEGLSLGRWLAADGIPPAPRYLPNTLRFLLHDRFSI